MINSITVSNHLGESVTLELRFPEKSGFLVRGIEGLGPSKANINTTETSGIDGSLYNSARAVQRNIVLTLGLLENPTIEDSRQKSYKYFPLKKRIKLEIETDNRTSMVYGYVESNEPNIFSKEETAVISLICPSAYLYDSEDQVTVFSSVTSNFEFPFSNESLVSNLIEFSQLNLQTTKTVLYEGDAPIGILLHIHAIGVATGTKIIESATLEFIEIDDAKLTAITGSGIINGDEIYISTVKGNKYATLVRGALEYNILNALGQDPKWFQLEKGDNVFAYTATTGLANLQFEIINKVAYEGI
jgi:hypothetical protein